MSYGTVQAEKMTTESGYSLGAGNASSFKNRIINGDMRVDQRNNGSALTVAPSSNQYYGIDRYQAWSFPAGAAGTWTWQRQTATPPPGFTYYGRATVTTPDTSLTTNDFYTFQQAVEGFNTADLDFGTANAKPFTVSFWVRSSITGTFSCSTFFSSGGLGYPLTYTINSANTWEYKTVNFPAFTSSSLSGADKTNGVSIYLIFALGLGSNFTGSAGVLAGAVYGVTGSTNLISTSGATLDITGIQLEVGTVATSFDVRPFPTELALCQRYYSQLVGNYSPDFIVPNASYVNYWTTCWQFPQVMRASPTVSQISGTTIAMDQFGIGPATVSSNQVGQANQYFVRITVITSSPSSADPGSAISAVGTFWQASAEL